MFYFCVLYTKFTEWVVKTPYSQNAKLMSLFKKANKNRCRYQ